MVAWIWLNLLQFCVSNQVFSPHEDIINKPWRPIPSRLISLESATRLRWALLPTCLFVSYRLGAPTPGLLLSIVIILHNESGLARYWVFKNGCCAAGYALFEWGATYLASGHSVSKSQANAIVSSALIVATTVHAQDFRDIEGDHLLHRSTLPIKFPRFSRLSMLPILVSWSFAMASTCGNNLLSVVLFTLAFYVGIRFVLLQSPRADGTNYFLYNLWLSFAHIALGLYARHSNTGHSHR